MSYIERRGEARHLAPTVPLPTAGPLSYRAASGLSRREQKREEAHAEHIEELRRDAVEGAAVVARDAFIVAAHVEAEGRIEQVRVKAEADALMAEDEAQARRLSELKWHLLRAKRESQLVADDMELSAKFAELDDDYFRGRRARGLG